MPKPINWTLQGKKVNPRTIKAELVESFEYELVATATAVMDEIEDLIRRLQRRAAERGQGFLAVRYNNVFEDVFPVAEYNRAGNIIKIRVPDNTRGGLIFNVLDAGRPAINGKKMSFPSYKGTVTSPNKLALNRTSVISPHPDPDVPNWITTTHVDPIEPRHFFEGILQKRKAKPERFRPREIFDPLPEIFPKTVPRFKWKEGDVKIRIVQSGK